MATFSEVDPSTGEALGAWRTAGPDDVEKALARAHDAYGAWRETSFPTRARAMRKAADLLEARADRYARLMALEMGKPLAQGVAEANKCAFACRWAADTAPVLLQTVTAPSDAAWSGIRAEPLGVILAIMPWNFPFWQLFRAAAPALMAGNAMVLKHAPNTLGCGDAIAELFLDAGFPEGLMPHLVLDLPDVAGVIADRRVRGVTLTGSARAGAAVGALAGQHLKKSVLELGGSDAVIVLADADVEQAARVAAQSRLINGGQSCIAAKRFLVVEPVAEAFTEAFARHLRAAVVGSPLDPATTVGPIARADLRDELHRQVERSVAAGATLEFGGQIPEGPGSFYPVTLLTGVGPGMPAWDEELFGPVAALRVVPDEDAAIEAANDSRYGLGCAVWTTDPTRIEALAHRLDVGALFVNGMVKSDPRLPFGGVRDSGYGRELGAAGLFEFVNVQTVWVAP